MGITTKKLYLVKLTGHCNPMNTDYAQSYVVASDAEEAYRRVRDYLDQRDLMVSGDRALRSVELIAEEGDYPECRTMLFS